MKSTLDLSMRCDYYSFPHPGQGSLGRHAALPAYRRSAGFTLMEILVAVVVFSILMLTIFTSFQAFVMSSGHINAAITRDEKTIPPLQVMTRDLMGVHFSLPPRYIKPDFRSNPDPFRMVGDETYVEGESFARLRLVSRGVLTSLDNTGDQMVQIIYYARAGDDGSVDLCRSETLPPWEESPETGCDPVLVKNISGFALVYRNTENDSFSHWDSDADAFDYGTPGAVEIRIRFKGDDANGADDEEDTAPPPENVVATTIALPVIRRGMK